MGRRLLFHLVLATVVLASLPPAARAPVDAASLATDRSDYVLGMDVTATATFVYNTGNFAQIDTPVLFEWFNATWVRLASAWVPKVDLGGRRAGAVHAWRPPGPGTYFVNATTNRSATDPTPVPAAATFTVWDPQDYVIALGILVATDRGGYEVGQTATATANLTANPAWVVGNVSRLERVRFDWRDPAGATVRSQVVAVTRGEATDAWVTSGLGANYSVTATYLGNDTVSNATSFGVFPATTLATNVSSGESVTWDAATLWRVCGDLLVAQGGSLTIEPGTTVKFCRGSRLLVEGTLTADASPAVPVNLTSYEFPPAAGDWRGVWIRATARVLAAGLAIEYVTDGVVVDGSAPVLVGLTLRSGTGDAVSFTASDGTLRDSAITGFARGIRVSGGVPLAENVTISGAREGIAVSGGSSGAVFRSVRVNGGNFSVAIAASDGVRFERASLLGAAIRAVGLNVATATFVNTTIAGGPSARDFLLVASTATLLNCTFVDDPARRTVVTPSEIHVQNFLAVEVRTPEGAPVAGARVAVTVNGRPLPEQTTDSRGLAAWIPVEDRVVNATGTAKSTVVVAVSRAGYSVEGTPRTVDMAASQTVVFLATPVGNPVDGAVPWWAFGLLAFLLAPVLVVLRRRRKPVAEEPAEPAEMPEPLPGRSYAVLTETPDPAFRRFAEDVRRGSPGLCITRIRPEDARARYGLPTVPVYWLSRSFGKGTLNPTNLGAIVELVRKETAKQEGTRVLVDGLEYLFTQNDFGKVVKFVQALADVVAENGAVLLLPVSPKSFESEDRLAILTRDLQKWP